MATKKSRTEIVLQIISIFISICGFIILFYMNQSTNTNLKEISNESNNKAAEIKKYEVNHLNKINTITDLNIIIKKLYKTHVVFCELTDHGWPIKYTSKELHITDSLKSIVNECIKGIDENTIKLFPYLEKPVSDSLKIVTDKFIKFVEWDLNLKRPYQGYNKDVNFKFWIFQEYIRFITTISGSIYIESI